MRKIVSWVGLLALVAGACDAGVTTDAEPRGASTDPPQPPITTPITTPISTELAAEPRAGTAAGSTPASTTPTTTTPTTSTTTSTSTSTSTSSTTTTTAPAVRSVGTAGDSLLLGMIPPLQRALERSGYDFRAQWFTGFLAPERGEYWAEVVADLPDVLIVFFAPWELSALNRGDLDLVDPTWPDRYVREFVEPLVAPLRSGDTEVIWIGLPPARDPVESAQYEFLNAIWRGVVENEPRMTWLDGAPLLAGPNGRYVEVDDTVSPPVRLFQTDGRHLCPEGGRRMTSGLLALLEDRFGVEVDPSWTESDWADNSAAYDFDKCPPP